MKEKPEDEADESDISYEKKELKQDWVFEVKLQISFGLDLIKL